MRNRTEFDIEASLNDRSFSEIVELRSLKTESLHELYAYADVLKSRRALGFLEESSQGY